VAERRGHQREGAVGPGVQRGDAWSGGKTGVGMRPAKSGGRRGDAPAASKQRGRQGKGKTGYFVISENFRDPDVNQR
jgi:hypothetical protein